MAEGVKGKVVEQQSVVGVKSEDPDLSTAHDVPRSVINGESSIIVSKMICFIVFYYVSVIPFCKKMIHGNQKIYKMYNQGVKVLGHVF